MKITRKSEQAFISDSRRWGSALPVLIINKEMKIWKDTQIQKTCFNISWQIGITRFTINTFVRVNMLVSEKDLKLSESDTSNFRRCEKIQNRSFARPCSNARSTAAESSTMSRGRTEAYPAAAARKLQNFREWIWRPDSITFLRIPEARAVQLPARLSKDFVRKETWAFLSGRQHAARLRLPSKRCPYKILIWTTFARTSLPS